MGNWTYPTAQEITGATKIKDADNKIQSAMNDLVDWANNEGDYSPNLGASFNYTTLEAMTDVLLGTKVSEDVLRWNGTKWVNVQAYDKTQVNNSLALKANIDSPTLTGTPLAPTPSVATDTTQIATTAFVRDIIPAGIISLWSGSIASIPTGWSLCDGSNGTPNLVDRFIVGAGSTYSVSVTGGSKDAIVVSHTHTGSTNTTGEHTHSIGAGDYICSVNGGSSPFLYGAYDSSTSSNGSHSHTLILDSTGSSGTDANLPPYFALAYIMKL